MNSRPVKLLLSGFLTLTMAAGWHSAHAAAIFSTNAQFLIGGALQNEDPVSGPPPAAIGSLVTTTKGASVDIGGPAFASASSTAGIGAVRADALFFAGSPAEEHELRAITNFGEMVTNNSGAARDYFFDFNVFGPYLEIDDFVFGPDATVSYSIEVLLNGAPIWNSSATLLGGGVSGATLIQSGSDLGSSFFCSGVGCNETNPGNVFGYTFGDFSDRLQLGSIADGESFTLETVLEVSVAALPFELGGLAFIGDPNDLGVGPGVSGAVGFVPVPAALGLFASGLIGLLGMARTKAA